MIEIPVKLINILKQFPFTNGNGKEIPPQKLWVPSWALDGYQLDQKQIQVPRHGQNSFFWQESNPINTKWLPIRPIFRGSLPEGDREYVPVSVPEIFMGSIRNRVPKTAHLYLSVFVCVKRLAKRFLIVAFFFCFRSRFIEFLLPIYRAAQASSNSNTINWMLLSRKMCECHYLELPCMFTSWQTFLMCF